MNRELVIGMDSDNINKVKGGGSNFVNKVASNTSV